MGVARLTDNEVRAAAEHAARTSRARLVSLIAAGNGDIALAEAAVATEFERALTKWPVSGVPKKPGCRVIDRRPKSATRHLEIRRIPHSSPIGLGPGVRSRQRGSACRSRPRKASRPRVGASV